MHVNVMYGTHGHGMDPMEAMTIMSSIPLSTTYSNKRKKDKSSNNALFVNFLGPFANLLFK